ncbi:MAG: hypothetical protein JWN84_1641 [Nocardioides sp.]|nr:hypothetical protein [Nocardioides sp.]
MGEAARRQGQLAWLLRYERRKHEMSQEALARLVGVQRTVVTHFETGARWTDTLIVYSLAAALGVETAPASFLAHWPADSTEG